MAGATKRGRAVAGSFLCSFVFLTIFVAHPGSCVGLKGQDDVGALFVVPEQDVFPLASLQSPRAARGKREFEEQKQNMYILFVGRKLGALCTTWALPYLLYLSGFNASPIITRNRIQHPETTKTTWR